MSFTFLNQLPTPAQIKEEYVKGAYRAQSQA